MERLLEMLWIATTVRNSASVGTCGEHTHTNLDRQIDEYIQPIDQQACARCELTQDNWVDPEGGERLAS